MHWYLKIPRFDGRKTLAFNGLVFIAASAAQIWLVAGGSTPTLDTQTWLMLLGGVAALNGLLRLVTERPVWWRQMSWRQMPFEVTMDYEPDEGEGEGDVYHKAAAFAHRDAQLHGTGVMQGGKHVPYADFQRELDSRLLDTREAFDGKFYGNGHLPELPLDAEGERH